jgi:prevent-host-death family protein
MPTTFNVHAAKTHLSRLLQRVAAGEEIVIARAGVPIARLVPYERTAKPRRAGRWAGRIVIGDDFDAPLSPDELAAWEDGAVEPTE